VEVVLLHSAFDGNDRKRDLSWSNELARRKERGSIEEMVESRK